MASNSRAFAQKLSKAPATDIRRQTAADLKAERGSYSSNYVSQVSRITFSDEGNTEPLDYEDYIASRPYESNSISEFPSDDIQVSLVSRKIRTLGHILPEEPINTLDPLVSNALNSYTSEWVVVKRKYQIYSTSSYVRDVIQDRYNVIENGPKYEFEVDEEIQNHEFLNSKSRPNRRSWLQNSFSAANKKNHRRSIPNSKALTRQNSSFSLNNFINESRPLSICSLDIFKDEMTDEDGDVTPTNDKIFEAVNNNNNVLSHFLAQISTPSFVTSKEKENGGETSTRGSWASFDLHNLVPDPLIPGLLDTIDIQVSDSVNRKLRLESRSRHLLSYYPPQSDEEFVERRASAQMPTENLKHRLLVTCNQLELNLNFEPLFASLALYDAKEKKKVSENFYFDLNCESLQKYLEYFVETIDISTEARSCIFDISSSSSSDLFLVLKLEKVLQGDITEAAEPYLKEVLGEKVRNAAIDACARLGKYRMPFAWTAIWLQNIIKGNREEKNDSESDVESSSSNSLERRDSGNREQFRSMSTRLTESSSIGKGSLERCSQRGSWSSGLIIGEDSSLTSLDNFLPVTLTVSSFFKQEGDRLKDEDLFKFLLDLKRPSPVLKRLKCIRGTLKLDISVAPDKVKSSLTPELTKILPYSDFKTRPIKEILEFPPKEDFVPNYHFRNLLYVCPKDLNFTNRSGERARNIAIKIQFMGGENSHSALPVIFGKSSCPEFSTEVFTAVTYHNKCPDFYEEVKIKLPSNLRDFHHILFTFYHVTCAGVRKEQDSNDVIVGYSWIPIFKNGSLQTGLFELPVLLECPPPRYSFISPESAPPGTKWVDGKKPIFSVELTAYSNVHPIDPFLDPFLNLTSSIQLGTPDSSLHNKKLSNSNMEEDLIHYLNTLSQSRLHPLVRFLPIICNKILLLMVNPPVMTGQPLSTIAFNTLASLVAKISSAPNLQHMCDRHGRNSLLTTFIHYSAHLPHPRNTFEKNTENEVAKIVARNIPSLRARNSGDSSSSSITAVKLVHETLAMQLSFIGNGKHKDVGLSSSWFFLELMIKAMIEHLATNSRLGTVRKNRFSDQFHDDVTNIVAFLSVEIISRQQNNYQFAQKLNAYLSFFLHDLLSVMDRGFVFSLIKMVMKDTTTARNASNLDSLNLWNLQLDFIRILCSHEHYVTLNLPSKDPISTGSRSSSPTPSTRSNDSQNSFITLSSSSSHSLDHWAELTPAFKRQHFLIGILLTTISSSLEQRCGEIHNRSINILRNLLTAHDLDLRYSDSEAKARVANLYLPLLRILIDNCSKLYVWNREESTGGSKTNLTHILNVISDNVPSSKGFEGTLKEEPTRHLLICFLWILKNVDSQVLKQYWSELSGKKLQILLEISKNALSCFEYKGKKVIRKNASVVVRKNSDHVRTKLEDLILGQGTARQDMMQRSRRDRLPPSPNPDGSRRWNKGSFLRNALQSSDSAPLLSSSYSNSCPYTGTHGYLDPESEAIIEGYLASEANMIILDTMELIISVVSMTDASTGILGSILRILLHALFINQSTFVLSHYFALQRSFVFKFPSLLFDEASEHCADLCLRLLKHSSSSISTVRSHASGSLYLLMRQNFEIGNNFARVKMQVTMSLSQLVGRMSNFNEDHLRKSLKTILVIAEKDKELSYTSFPEQVQDLVVNLHMILSDTVKMKEYNDDPEMHMDLMYRIAKGYQNSPDLRLTWLESMAKKHEEQGHYAEAAMCKVHCAALVSEYLYMLEDRKYMPVGAVTFSNLSPNVLEESAVSDDIVSPDEEGICTGRQFSETGLMTMIDEAAKYYSNAGMYEAINELYKIGLPIAEFHRNFSKLSDIYSDLHDACFNIHRLQGKRIFGTYFRVGFYGARTFGDLDGEEFVYKEKALAKLPEIAQRLEHFYGEKFGVDNLIIIKDSKNVEPSKLNPDKAYIQITYVEPYFDTYELRDRITVYEKNFNILRFVFATPFTLEGNAHGELAEQYKRKTILTAANHFPYIKTRIQIIDRKQIVLTPIEVAIEDIQKKTRELEIAVNQDPPDPKILQMVLQGCIGTTVNQGPMEVANVFLKDLFDSSSSSSLTPNKHQNKLRLCFKDFSKKCKDALERNKKLITVDQKEYQRELAKNYATFERHLASIFTHSTNEYNSSNLVHDKEEFKVTSPMI